MLRQLRARINKLQAGLDELIAEASAHADQLHPIPSIFLADVLTGSLKKIERREKTLAEHIRHAENYFEHQALYKQYKQVKPRRLPDFYERHRTRLALFEAAQQYLKPVLNGRDKIPLQAWKKEYAQCGAEKQALYAGYLRLKDEVKDAEVIRRCVEDVLRDERQKNVSRNISTEL